MVGADAFVPSGLRRSLSLCVGRVLEMAMAFEMFTDTLNDEIGHHEEYLFALASEDASRYPGLCSMGGNLYNDPRISPRESGALVHELI